MANSFRAHRRYHTYTTGGGLTCAGHADFGSVLTLSVMLSDPDPGQLSGIGTLPPPPPPPPPRDSAQLCCCGIISDDIPRHTICETMRDRDLSTFSLRVSRMDDVSHSQPSSPHWSSPSLPPSLPFLCVCERECVRSTTCDGCCRRRFCHLHGGRSHPPPGARMQSPYIRCVVYGMTRPLSIMHD